MLEQIVDKLFAPIFTIFLGAITALIVAYINNKTQFFGKLRIFSQFSTHHHLPAVVLGGSDSNSTKQQVPRESKMEYIIRFICFNSKAIPIYLEHFSVEMRVQGSKRAKVIHVVHPEPDVTDTGQFKVIVPLGVSEQVILPRVMHEFKIKLSTDGEVAEISQLKLVCYDEKRKRQKYLLHEGVKLSKLKDARYKNSARVGLNSGVKEIPSFFDSQKINILSLIEPPAQLLLSARFLSVSSSAICS